MIIRWLKGKPYVYESMMAYDGRVDGQKQKYLYRGSYVAWRGRRRDRSYLDDVLKPYQALKLTAHQRGVLTKIDMAARRQIKRK